ncbi:MAG: hypothetical protein ACRBN8_34380 [Nannocystales bacterium]
MNKLVGGLAGVVALLGVVSTAVALPTIPGISVLEDFEQLGTGPVGGNGFQTKPVGNGEVFGFEGYDLSIEDFPGQKLRWDDQLFMDFRHNGKRPLEVVFDLSMYSSPVTVRAFDDGGKVIFDQTYTAQTQHHVVITSQKERILYVELTGGSNETYVDDVWVTWP